MGRPEPHRGTEDDRAAAEQLHASSTSSRRIAATLVDEVTEHAHKTYEEKEQGLGADKMRTLERLVLLGTIDRLWVYHLTALDEMRQGIGLTRVRQAATRWSTTSARRTTCTRS